VAQQRAEINDSIRQALGTTNTINYVARIGERDLREFFDHNDFLEAKQAEITEELRNMKTPKSRRQALRIDEERGDNRWSDSMRKEHSVLLRRGTWKVVPLRKIPKGSKILRSIWTFKIKSEDGTWTSDKSRGCCDGRTQVKGQDYYRSYSPTTKLSTVRTTQALAIDNDMWSRQVDIDNAFLYGKVEDDLDLYMYPFEGFEEYEEYWNVDLLQWLWDLLVCLLIMGLYGLCQAALLFNQVLISSLTKQGFVQSYKDPALFILNTPEAHIMLPVHVDDLLPTGKPYSAILTFEDRLEEDFDIKRLGNASWYSAIKITRTANAIHMGQSAFATEHLMRWNLQDAHEKHMPLPAGLDLMNIARDKTNPEYEDTTHDSTEVKGYVGQMAWLADSTRPDFSNARMQSARLQQQCPTNCFRIMTSNIGGYLKRTKHLGVKYFSGTKFKNEPILFCDTDYATCTVTRRSVCMIMVFLHGGPIYWRCKLMPDVVAGTMGTEHMGLYMAACEAKYFRSLLREMGFPQVGPTKIYCDNDAAVQFATEMRITQENKHVDIKYMGTKMLQDRGIIDIQYKSTYANMADIGTKAMKDIGQFELLRDHIVRGPE
jgi:hypothetical protein